MTEKQKQELAKLRQKHEQRKRELLTKNKDTRTDAMRNGDHPLWKEKA